jgi:DNA polymerase III delta subunit
MSVGKRAVQVFVVSFGAEDYFLDQDLARARAWSDRSVVQLNGEGLTDAQLVSVCEEIPYDDSKRVVILDSAEKTKGDKRLRAYIEAKDLRDESTVLVAIVRSEKLPEVWNLAAKKGKLLEHKKLKTWDNNNEVIKWVETEARNLKLVLDKGVPQLLFQFVGPNLWKLSNELRKLTLLVGENGHVGRDQLKLTIAPSPSAEPFQVAEAAVAKDVRKAMDTLSTVYRNMGDEAHVPITFSLIKQIEKFVVARDLLDKGTSEEDIASVLGMHPWRCKTVFMPAVQKHKMKDLVAHMTRLRKLDADVKGAARSKRTLVELSVLAIAQ